MTHILIKGFIAKADVYVGRSLDGDCMVEVGLCCQDRAAVKEALPQNQ